MTRTPFLSIRDITIRIDGRDIFRCDLFDIAVGDKILVTSRSGAGKSVFLRCLAGLQPIEHVKTGKFTRHIYGGRSETLSYPAYARQRRAFSSTSYVFQDAINALNPLRTISAQLRQGRPHDNDQSLETDLERFRLGDLNLLRERRFRDSLSGGQCQRISLLFAADAERQLVLLDEPLTDIDAFSRASIEDLLVERLFNKASGKTVILVTHDAHWLSRLDRELMRHFSIDTPTAEFGGVAVLVELTDDRKLRIRSKDLPPARPERIRLDPKDLQPSTGSALPASPHRAGSLSGAPSVKQVTVSSGAEGQANLLGNEIADVPIMSMKIERRISPGGDSKSGFQIWPLQMEGNLENGIAIRRGEGVALYGLSGSGKSFLLRCMAGLWSKSIMAAVKRDGQHDLAQGDAIVPLKSLKPAQLASNIQYIFQNNRGSVSLSETLDADLSVLKAFAIRNTRRLLRAYPSPSPDVASSNLTRINDREINELIDRMVEDLWDRLCIPRAPLKERNSFKLSGLSLGMLRRYSLIRALIKLDLHTVWQGGNVENPFASAAHQIRFKPRLLLADEISRGLDGDSLYELAKLIRDLKQSALLSVVVVSHENRFTAAIAERIHLVVDGFVMPTSLSPVQRNEGHGGEPRAFSAPVGLLNPIYDMYCPRTDCTAAAGRAPDTLAKLSGSNGPGCVVHKMLIGAVDNTGEGCPNHGKDKCTDARQMQLNRHGTCC